MVNNNQQHNMKLFGCMSLPMVDHANSMSARLQMEIKVIYNFLETMYPMPGWRPCVCL